jgi:hypothetical protein
VGFGSGGGGISAPIGFLGADLGGGGIIFAERKRGLLALGFCGIGLRRTPAPAATPEDDRGEKA